MTSEERIKAIYIMRTEKEIRERIAYYEERRESMKEKGQECDYLLERICELCWVLGYDYFGRDEE